MSTPIRWTSAGGTSNGSCGCGKPRSPHPDSYFRRYADLTDAEAVETANRIWSSINEPNLVENILPTRGRATLVMTKGPDHAVSRIRLRKL